MGAMRSWSWQAGKESPAASNRKKYATARRWFYVAATRANPNVSDERSIAHSQPAVSAGASQPAVSPPDRTNFQKNAVVYGMVAAAGLAVILLIRHVDGVPSTGHPPFFGPPSKGSIDMTRSAALITAFVLLPAVLIAQKTSFDYDKTATFSAFKSYALKDGTNVGDPLIDNRIVAAIEKQLAAKGLTKTDAKPDLTVMYHVAFDKQKDISAFSTGGGPYGYRWGGGWGSTDVRVKDILVGTLVIDIADANKGEVVWRGMGVKEVDVQAKADKRDKNINNAVQKILKNYPPKSGT